MNLFPCRNCLVKAACNKKCELLEKAENFWSEKFGFAVAIVCTCALLSYLILACTHMPLWKFSMCSLILWIPSIIFILVCINQTKSVFYDDIWFYVFILTLAPASAIVTLIEIFISLYAKGEIFNGRRKRKRTM